MDLDVPECIRLYMDDKGGMDGIKKLLPSENQVKHASKIFHSLSSPVRVKVLRLLQERPLCPCILAQAIGVASSKLSYHLSALQQAGLIKGEQKGRWIMYSLTPLGEEMLVVAGKLIVKHDSTST